MDQIKISCDHLDVYDVDADMSQAFCTIIGEPDCANCENYTFDVDDEKT